MFSLGEIVRSNKAAGRQQIASGKRHEANASEWLRRAAEAREAGDDELANNLRHQAMLETSPEHVIGVEASSGPKSAARGASAD